MQGYILTFHPHITNLLQESLSEVKSSRRSSHTSRNRGIDRLILVSTLHGFDIGRKGNGADIIEQIKGTSISCVAHFDNPMTVFSLRHHVQNFDRNISIDGNGITHPKKSPGPNHHLPLTLTGNP